VWSYPNLHGDEVVTADNSGTRSAGHASYDPFGQPIDPVTGNIGSTSADDTAPDTSNGNQADNGWVGSHQSCMSIWALLRLSRRGVGPTRRIKWSKAIC